METGAGGLSIRRVSEYCYPPAREYGIGSAVSFIKLSVNSNLHRQFFFWREVVVLQLVNQLNGLGRGGILTKSWLRHR